MSKIIINKILKSPVKERVMKKVVKRFLKKISNPKYEFGFQITSIHKKWSNLPAYVCVDNTGTWINLGDKKIILFESDNSGNADFSKLLPMTIENDPQILNYDSKISLTDDEINRIKSFVKDNQKELLLFAVDMGISEFFKKLTERGYYRER